MTTAAWTTPALAAFTSARGYRVDLVRGLDVPGLGGSPLAVLLRVHATSTLVLRGEVDTDGVFTPVVDALWDAFFTSDDVETVEAAYVAAVL